MYGPGPGGKLNKIKNNPPKKKKKKKKKERK